MSEEMFNEAVRAFKSGQRRRARDLFTRLLKTDPNQLDYWLWMSAAVDTEKEQLFCLQKALKLDPNSPAARRGLVMLGGLKPEEAALPAGLSLDDFAPSLPASRAIRVAGGFLASNRNREMALLIGAGILAVVVVGLLLIAVFAPQVFRPPRVVVITPTTPPTASPAPTGSPTATATRQICPTPADPNPATPLAVYLCAAPATPSAPLAVATANTRSEDYTSMLTAYKRGDWATVLARAQVLRDDQVIAAEPSLYFYEAEAYRFKGQFKEAIASYRTALDKSPKLAPAFYGRGLARFAQADGPGGLKDLEAALAADANFWPAAIAHAEYYAANGNFTRAQTDLEQAQASAPDNAEVLARLAAVYVEVGRAQDALTLANQALQLDVASVPAYYARGAAALLLGQWPAAAADLALTYRYIADDASFQSLYPVASALNFGNAYAATALYRYAAAQVALGHDDLALPALNEALTRRANFPPALVARGQVSLRAQQYDDARADFNAAIGQLQSDPQNPTLAEAYLGNGQALLSLTPPNSAAAISNLQAAARITPQSYTINLWLGRALVVGAQPDKALDPLTQALALATTDAQKAEVFWWRSQAYQAGKRLAEAVGDLQALLSLAEAPDLAPTAQARLTQIGPLPTATPTLTPTGATPTPSRATITPNAQGYPAPSQPVNTVVVTGYPAAATATPKP